MYDIDDGWNGHIVTIVISDTVFDSSSPSPSCVVMIV